MNFTTAQFLHIGQIAPDPTWHMTKHQHKFHELIVVLNGQISVTIRNQTRTAGAGELLWYPYDTPHEERSIPAAPVNTLFIAFFWPDADPSTPIQMTDYAGRVRLLARWLYAERESFPELRQPIADAWLQAILAEIARLASHPTDSLVTCIRAHMRAHLANPINLGDLAALAGMSKYHFARRYKQLTGHTPMEDLRRIRVLAAHDLLLTTNFPLKTLAPRVGLGDEYHLSRLIRKHFHTSPGKLRRRS